MKNIVHGARDFVLRTTRHPLGFIGVNLTTFSAILLVVLLMASILGLQSNPYIGAVTFLVLPGVFIVGLLLIPLGSYRERRRIARGGPSGPAFPTYDLNRPEVRNRFVLIGALTVINMTLLAIVSYKGVEYMDSVEFCGQTCHPVMKPEFTVYEVSPHSRVRCVDCHIGPGASWFVKSKLSGSRQVIKQLTGTWPKPVETPVENLRPSRDTCEQCHWPEKFHGDRVRVRTHFAEDSANTKLQTVLLLKVGGGNPESGFRKGIHSHIFNKVYYRSDAEREVIPWVRVERADGTTTEYVSGGPDAAIPDSIAQRPMRLMDCIDCHNRPTHIYRLPHRAIDEAMAGGSIPANLPYIKREGLALLSKDYASRDEAFRAIDEGVRSFYAANPVDFASLEGGEGLVGKAVDGLREVWSTYVFPEMRVTWGTYPDHIGHTDFTGCFRCHDDGHVAEDGRTISQDCTNCHNLLAIEEKDPEVLKSLFPE